MNLDNLPIAHECAKICDNCGNLAWYNQNKNALWCMSHKKLIIPSLLPYHSPNCPCKNFKQRNPQT